MNQPHNNWRYFLRWENLFYGLTLLAALVVTVLGFLQIIPNSIMNLAILLVLTAITALLLESHIVITRLRVQLESPSIVKMLRPFGEYRDEIHQRLGKAQEFWFLSRSGLKFIKTSYKEELEGLMRRGRARYLLLAPQGGAIKMVEECQEEELDKKEVIYRHQNIYQEFLTQLNKRCLESRSDLRLIDHLSAWSLYIFEPAARNENSVIYIEMATYRPRPAGRPVFKVTIQDGEYFDMFLREFNSMWEKAHEWHPLKPDETPPSISS